MPFERLRAEASLREIGCFKWAVSGQTRGRHFVVFLLVLTSQGFNSNPARNTEQVDRREMDHVEQEVLKIECPLHLSSA